MAIYSADVCQSIPSLSNYSVFSGCDRQRKHSYLFEKYLRLASIQPAEGLVEDGLQLLGHLSSHLPVQLQSHMYV